MRKLSAAILVLFIFTQAPAQILFHYGKDSVSVPEFLKAYRKNNTGNRTEAAFREYLDLYIASRLKIAEARSMGLDSSPQMQADLQALRMQIIPSYMNDRESVGRLTQEAFARAGKDIRLAHIFISLKSSAYNQPAAAAKAEEALAALRSGTSFTEVATRYSDDPAVGKNGGELGWITVFSLPYELENLAYGTSPGQISAIHQSRAGYHIFKNLGERKAAGRIRAAQILLAIPPDATPEQINEIRNRADSLYTRIRKGDNFGKLAMEFSNDVVSAANAGQMPEFGAGDFDPAFETMVYGLKDGAVSRPFQTTHGIHIVRRIGHSPIPATADQEYLDRLKTRVENSDRLSFAREEFIRKLRGQVPVSEPSFSFPSLWIYSDSLLNRQPMKAPMEIQPASVLFRVAGSDISAADWILYARMNRHRHDGTGNKSYPVLWEEFVDAMVMKYYQDHLEDYNEDFRNQLAEFHDGNLFFEIMQIRVWGPAQSDSAALEDYFIRNREKYKWGPSAESVLFYAADADAAGRAYEALRRDPSGWQYIVAEMSDRLAADSGRFELSHIPNGSKKQLKAGMVTSPLVNPDGSASLAWVVKIYPGEEARSFREARGLVITDYQQELEKRWLEDLRARYTVSLNQEAWQRLLKEKAWQQ